MPTPGTALASTATRGARGAENAALGLNGMSHKFVVRIDNASYDLGTWTKASGLSVNWDVCQYRAGDHGNAVWIYPGMSKYETIKLTRQACIDSVVVQKWLTTTSKSPQPLTGAIALVNWMGLTIVTWELKQFFPVGWSIAEFDAGTGKAITETLQLAHTGFLDDEVKK
ncbi:MAG TPA: phage tail protein [Mycobacteriales bacterium]|jgi:phage tail-like protein|nr:phage tail protein [Mycobacteriales bacterium]